MSTLPDHGEQLFEGPAPPSLRRSGCPTGPWRPRAATTDLTVRICRLSPRRRPPAVFASITRRPRVSRVPRTSSGISSRASGVYAGRRSRPSSRCARWAQSVDRLGAGDVALRVGDRRRHRRRRQSGRKWRKLRPTRKRAAQPRRRKAPTRRSINTRPSCRLTFGHGHELRRLLALRAFRAAEHGPFGISISCRRPSGRNGEAFVASLAEPTAASSIVVVHGGKRRCRNPLPVEVEAVELRPGRARPSV